MVIRNMIRSYDWLNPRVLLAFVLYAFTNVMLWMIEYRIYGGAVGTVFAYVSIYPPLFLVGFLIFGKRQLKRERKELRAKAMGMTGSILLVGCVLVGYNFLSGDAYRHLTDWQILSIVVAVSAIGVFESKRDENIQKVQKVDYISLIFGLLMLTTLMFLLITRPYSVARAERVLSDYGYQDLHYLNHLTKEYEDLPEETGPLGVYVFVNNLGQEVFVVDITSGRVLE